MNLKTKLVDSANAVISAKVDAKSVDDKVEKLAKDAAKKIKIDGFRAGKVPVAVVKKRYGNDLRKDAEQEILRQIVEDSLKELNRKAEDMIGEPTIPKFDDKNGEIDIEIEVSFKPSVNVSGYEELIPEHSTPRVSKKEIETKKEELLSYIAPIEKVDKNELEKGDFAKFDFEGFVDGEAFEGGKANDYVLEIGSNQFIPGFEDGMIGLKVGESKDIKVTFPKDYGAANLAGKDAIFKVKLHEIQGKKIPETINDEILKKLMPGEENVSVEKLDDRLKDQIRNEKLQKLIQEDLKPKFVDLALEKFKFDLPKNIVEQEIDMQFRNAWSSFSEDDMKKFREDKDALTKKRDEYRDEAIKSVSITFIVDELAKAKNITVSDQELIQTIYFEAYRYGIDPKQHLENYKNQGILPAVKMAMIEERLFDALFNKDEKKTKEK